jgi:hypothetical protein
MHGRKGNLGIQEWQKVEDSPSTSSGQAGRLVN